MVYRNRSRASCRNASQAKISRNENDPLEIYERRREL